MKGDDCRSEDSSLVGLLRGRDVRLEEKKDRDLRRWRTAVKEKIRPSLVELLKAEGRCGRLEKRKDRDLRRWRRQLSRRRPESG
jgi:hypothetical protein